MFGFLKNKLKEWVGKAKEKIAGAEEPISKETELAATKKPKKQKKEKISKEKKEIKKII